ncbi:aminotransferase [Candidatus Marinamargulisbacteria bacterium SCGC AG-343-D04]|nr:aminotransferase [Candidatus Marinamargulisbacteria bacterium SCGC AG-343-D04]
MVNSIFIKESQKSETLLINEVSRLKESQGEQIFKFGFGQSPFFPPQYIIDTLAKFSPRKEYVSVQGIEELREAIANFHNHYDSLSIQKEDVIVGPGSKMLIYCILAAFKEADAMIVTPSWVSYEPQAHLAKLNVVRINTNYQSRWRLTPELLEDACEKRQHKERPAILILNYPGNPDGLSYSEAELQALGAAFRKHNILVISDEIYGLLNHDGQHHSLARYYPEGTIVTTGLSKWCGAGGWRLGVALMPSALNPKFKQTVIGIASETYSCAASPVQYAGIQAYQVDSRIDDYLFHQRRILKLIGQHVYKALKDIGTLVHEPQGGFYLNPDFSPFQEKLKQRGVQTSESLCEKLLKDTGVAILPGNAFGYPDEQLITRLAYVDFNGTEALAGSEKWGKESDLDENFLNEYCPKVLEGTARLVSWLS